MSSILQFNISYEDGAYTADGVNAPIVTFGHTFEELQQNIREAVALFFEGEEPQALGFTSSPSILASFELPTIAYGGKA
jgi:predicted RNase H-like HicB family nuclease